jgi:hypothetical protein
MLIYELENGWKGAGLEKQRNFPGFYPEVRALKESQDNGYSGRDLKSLRRLFDVFLLRMFGFDPNPTQVGFNLKKKVYCHSF